MLISADKMWIDLKLIVGCRVKHITSRDLSPEPSKNLYYPRRAQCAGLNDENINGMWDAGHTQGRDRDVCN